MPINKHLMLITWLTSIMCQSFRDIAQQVVLCRPQTAVCGGGLVNVLYPQVAIFGSNFFLVLWSNICKVLIFQKEFSILGPGRDLVCRGSLRTNYLPLSHVSVGTWQYVSRYMATILVRTQYYQIPSIRNGDAASATRATDELYIRAAQPTLPLRDSMLVYPRSWPVLVSKHGANTPTGRQHKC